jgi:cardiolipin synthase
MKELFQKIFKKVKSEILTIPNMLSIVRILIIPVIVYLYCFKHDSIATLIWVIISTLTDIADGYIARRFNMITDFGKFIDPVADKATQLAVFACLVTKFPLMLLPFIVLLVKEIGSLLLRLYLYKKTEIVEGAKWHGKASTGVVIFIVVLHLAWVGIPAGVSLGAIIFSTAFMLFSGTLYTVEALKLLKYGKK